MVGVSVSAVGVVGEADCRGQGVQKNSRWGAVIPLCPFLPSSSSHPPPTYSRPLRINHKITPILTPPHHPHPNQSCIHTPTTLPPHSRHTHFLLRCYVSVSSLLVKPKAQVATFCPLKCLMNCATVAMVRKHSSDCRVNDEWLSKAETSRLIQVKSHR